MKLIITGHSGKDKRRIRALIEKHTDLRVTKKYPWLQEFIAGTMDCAILHPRTVLSYPEISVEQGMREVDLIKDNKVTVIFIESSKKSSGAITLAEQAKLNKDIITLRMSHIVFKHNMNILKERLRTTLKGIWKDDVQEQ